MNILLIIDDILSDLLLLPNLYSHFFYSWDYEYPSSYYRVRRMTRGKRSGRAVKSSDRARLTPPIVHPEETHTIGVVQLHQRQK